MLFCTVALLPSVLQATVCSDRVRHSSEISWMRKRNFFFRKRRGIFYFINLLILILIYLLTGIGLSPGGSSTVHIYTQTIHRTTQNKKYIEQYNNLGECGSCPFLTSYTLVFALQLRKKHGKTSVRVAASKNT